MKFLVVAKWPPPAEPMRITASTRDVAFEQAGKALELGARSVTIKPKTPGVKKND